MWLALAIVLLGLVIGLVLRRRLYPKWGTRVEFATKAAAAVGVALLIYLEPGITMVPVEVFLAALIVWAFSDWFRKHKESLRKAVD